jgi:DNA-directed RNA polymerase alpha subunit
MSKKTFSNSNSSVAGREAHKYFKTTEAEKVLTDNEGARDLSQKSRTIKGGTACARRRQGEGGVNEPNMLHPTPELPDDTPISDVEFPARIRNVLAAAGLKTVGEVRETSDEILLSFQHLGKASVAHLRETLGLPSCDGVRPLGKSLPDLPI